jgi:hypothetical protein
VTEQRSWPETFPTGVAVTSMHLRREGGGGRRLLGLGGPGRWVVTADDGRALAGATDRLLSADLEVEVGPRRVTARMPGVLRIRSPKAFEVTDDVAGHQVAEGRLIGADTPSKVFRREEWSVTVGGGPPMAFVQSVEAPRTLGWYDPAGPPLLLAGHDPSFDASGSTSTVGVLFKFWRAAAESRDVYRATVDAEAAGRFVSADDLPLLALLTIWLERTTDARYGTGDAPG